MSNRVKWILGIGMLVVVLGIAWMGAPGLASFWGPPAKDPMALRAPVRILPLSGGYQLEVFGLAEDEWVDGILSAPGGGLNTHLSNSSTYSHGDEKDYLQIERFNLNGKLAGVRLWIREGCLMMSVRLLDHGGGAVSPEEMKPGDLEIQLSDGAGEWIRGYGPHGAENDTEKRALVVFEGWPRGGPELVFRTIRAGGTPVEFRLPNPAAGRKPATWVAETLPQTRSHPHWNLELKEVREVRVPGSARGLSPVFEFENGLPKSAGEVSAISHFQDGIQGARGTRSSHPMVTRGNGGRLLRVFPAPPDESLFKILYRVRYRENYPLPKVGAVIVAEGVVSADGKTMGLSSRYKVLGLQTIEVGAAIRGKRSWFNGGDGFEFNFAGVWSNAGERSAAEAQLGPWKDWQGVVFLDGEVHSAGGMIFTGSRISNGISKTEFSWSGGWTGEWKPGMKVEIGLMERKPDDILEFVVDRSSVIRE